jgi:hypothetical protein
MCISTGLGGPQQPVLSVEHMVGCCHVCGYGCGDGFPNYAWAWLAGQKGKPYGALCIVLRGQRSARCRALEEYSRVGS